MLELDFRLLLFILLLLWFLTLVAAIALDRWLYRRELASLIQGGGALEPLLSQLPFALLLLQGPRVHYSNALAARLLALPPTSATLPTAPWVAWLEEDRLSARQDESGRFRTVPIAGEQWVRWWLLPWGRYDLLIVQDATATERAEQQARFLISDLSHELRTPLATLLTHLEVLRLPHLPPETHRHSLELMQQEIKRLNRLTNELLELGRLETGAPLETRALSLLPLLEHLLAELTVRANEKAITLSLQAEAALPPVTGDRDRLYQLFLNLLDNALKYGGPGTTVTVHLRRQANGIHCIISDDGPGIPAEHLPHVSRRFYRASGEAVEGSGLGLALAAEILRRHGTELHIQSPPAGAASGTSISFLLPLFTPLEVVS